jgi:hypothetical protein
MKKRIVFQLCAPWFTDHYTINKKIDRQLMKISILELENLLKGNEF